MESKKINVVEATPAEIRKRMPNMDKAGGLFDPTTHKLYPFYYSTTFSVDPQGCEHGYLKCNYTGEVDTGNGCYYGACIIFHSADDIRYSPYHPKHLGIDALCYHDQQYGFKTPFEFPEWAESSLVHCVAWYCFCGRSHSFMLKQYVGKRFTIDDLHTVFGDKAKLNTFGGSFEYAGFDGFIDCMSGKAKLRRHYSSKDDYVFTIGDLCKALNELLGYRQLSLF